MERSFDDCGRVGIIAAEAVGFDDVKALSSGPSPGSYVVAVEDAAGGSDRLCIHPSKVERLQSLLRTDEELTRQTVFALDCRSTVISMGVELGVLLSSVGEVDSLATCAWCGKQVDEAASFVLIEQAWIKEGRAGSLEFLFHADCAGALEEALDSMDEHADVLLGDSL